MMTHKRGTGQEEDLNGKGMKSRAAQQTQKKKGCFLLIHSSLFLHVGENGRKDHIKKEFLNYGPPRERYATGKLRLREGPWKLRWLLRQKSTRKASYHGLSRSWSECRHPVYSVTSEVSFLSPNMSWERQRTLQYLEPHKSTVVMTSSSPLFITPETIIRY